jgi:hypothetical protein
MNSKGRINTSILWNLKSFFVMENVNNWGSKSIKIVTMQLKRESRLECHIFLRLNDKTREN